MPTKTFERILDGEHIIAEQDRLMSRDQITLIADANGYKAGTVLAKLTGGGNVGKWCKFDPAGANGAAVAKGVLMDRRRPSTGTQRAVAHTRLCRLNGKKLTWDSPIAPTNNEKLAAIAALMGTNSDGTGGVQIGF